MNIARAKRGIRGRNKYKSPWSPIVNIYKLNDPCKAVAQDMPAKNSRKRYLL